MRWSRSGWWPARSGWLAGVRASCSCRSTAWWRVRFPAAGLRSQYRARSIGLARSHVRRRRGADGQPGGSARTAHSCIRGWRSVRGLPRCAKRCRALDRCAAAHCRALRPDAAGAPCRRCPTSSSSASARSLRARALARHGRSSGCGFTRTAVGIAIAPANGLIARSADLQLRFTRTHLVPRAARRI